MNRLVLIGNGFDIAHGLPTRYEDFINWYWEQRMYGFNATMGEHAKVSKDELCSFKILYNDETWSTFAFSHSYFNANPITRKEYVGKEVIASIIGDKQNFETKFSPFFEQIIKNIETKGWVDIENEYYGLLKHYAFDSVMKEESKYLCITSLNHQLNYLKDLLVKYLGYVSSKNKTGKFESIEEAIYAPFEEDDISVEGKKYFEEHKRYWESQESEDLIAAKIDKFGLDYKNTMRWVRWYREDNNKRAVTYPSAFLLPDEIMFLNFNYTDTVQNYIKPSYSQSENHIHGDIHDSRKVIFGYGDELDAKYKELKELNIEGCLSYVKSIRYLEAPNYRKVLTFIESAPFQVLIMGHSCGNSDRTLLNTIFEHSNCVSIKPYYYKDEDNHVDNYMELVQNISRNFTDMKLMRDRVVNKTQCEPLIKV